MVIGIFGGYLAQKFYSDSDIQDFLFSQLILFKLVLVPPIIYEM